MATVTAEAMATAVIMMKNMITNQERNNWLIHDRYKG
jgi:hypothetical protein